MNPSRFRSRNKAKGNLKVRITRANDARPMLMESCVSTSPRLGLRPHTPPPFLQNGLV